MNAERFLKQLLDRIDPDADLLIQLGEVIAGATELEPWIKALIQTPHALAYCKSRCIRFDQVSGQIYLLSKTQMNGMHAELFTYALYHRLRADLDKYVPLSLGGYEEVSEALSEAFFFFHSLRMKCLCGFRLDLIKANFTCAITVLV
ncbi:hypothetical protein CAQ69_17865 [Stutzerimonas stutzeri]|nr:hypothetical protein CAQ69_17865 [Stutzerimonas stutzeri]